MSKSGKMAKGTQSGSGTGGSSAGRSGAGKSSASESTSWVKQGSEFVSESMEELKRISTPTKAETIQATLVTIVIMSFVALALFVMDMLFSAVMKSII